jgi:hypothetical protein
MDRIYRQPGKCAFTGDICAAGMNREWGFLNFLRSRQKEPSKRDLTKRKESHIKKMLRSKKDL